MMREEYKTVQKAEVHTWEHACMMDGMIMRDEYKTTKLQYEYSAVQNNHGRC